MEVHMELNKEAVCVSFSKDSLTWIFNDSGFVPEIIRPEYILSVQMKYRSGKLNILDIHYIREEKDNIMRKYTVQFSGTEQNCENLKDEIQQYLKHLKRPRRLLVVINPNGGKKKALKVYKQHAEWLFKLCNIEPDVIVTSEPKEATKRVEFYDLSSIDGIVAVGGDGLVCECMNGLIAACQKEVGINIHNTESILKKCSLPIGIIPAGSGDVTVQHLNGTRDATTAAMRIILGRTVQTNAASIHEDGRLVGYSALILGFGLFGQMMYDCEQFRWMGPKRYKVIPLKTILTKRQMLDVEVEYLPEDDTKINKPRFARQISCPAKRYSDANNRKLQRIFSTPSPDMDCLMNEWKKTDGKVYAVDTHPIAMTEKSGKMAPDFGDNALTMILTDKCSLVKHITQLKMVEDEKPKCYDFDFVRKMRVKAYRVKLPRTPMITDESGNKCLAKNYYINCDGEFIQLKKKQFEVRLHCKVVKMFGSVAD